MKHKQKHKQTQHTAAPRPRTHGVADGNTRERAAQRHIIGVDVRRAVRQLRARKEVARDALRDAAAHDTEARETPNVRASTLYESRVVSSRSASSSRTASGTGAPRARAAAPASAAACACALRRRGRPPHCVFASAPAVSRHGCFALLARSQHTVSIF